MMSENGSNKLQMYTAPEAIEAKQKLADMAKQAGLLPDGMTTEQAILVMERAHELGIPPMTAFETMYVIGNKVSLEGKAMLGLILNSGKCAGISYEVIREDEGWKVTMKRSDMELEHTEAFNMDDATTAGIAKGFAWQKYPRIMLRWRAIAACARVVFPDVIGGLYLPEELGAEVEVDSEGDVRVVGVEVEEPPTEPGADVGEPEAEPEAVEAETEGIPSNNEELIETYAMGQKLGYSQVKIDADIAAALPDHLPSLITEWQGLLDKKKPGEMKQLGDEQEALIDE